MKKSKWIIHEPKTILEFISKHPSIRITVEQNVLENGKVFRFDGNYNNTRIQYNKMIPNSEFGDMGFTRDIERLLCCEAEYKLSEVIENLELIKQNNN